MPQLTEHGREPREVGVNQVKGMADAGQALLGTRQVVRIEVQADQQAARPDAFEQTAAWPAQPTVQSTTI